MNDNKKDAVLIVLSKVENGSMDKDEALSLILALTDDDHNCIKEEPINNRYGYDTKDMLTD